MVNRRIGRDFLNIERGQALLTARQIPLLPLIIFFDK